jgi:eukaryotic-like serine/threonine-protein kinase
VNLSSWKKQPLAEWISNELSEKYRVPRKIGRFWLQHDYLLPLLDGLDEIETSMQPECVTEINAFIEEFRPSGLVVCCRLNEYRWLPKRLKLSVAICIEPLSAEEVSKYLDVGGSKLATLRAGIDADPALHELAQTPLMLSIMSLAYQGADGGRLAREKGDSPEERRKQIFGLYLEQMFKRKATPSLEFPKEKTIGWLSWMAGRMREHSQSGFLVEGLQPSWLGPGTKWVTYGTVVALTLGLIFGLSIGLSAGLTAGLRIGLIAGLIAMSVISLGVALGCWSDSPLKNGTTTGTIFGLVFGLSFGLCLWLTSLLTHTQINVLIFGLIFGLIVGSLVGLIVGLGVGSLNHISLVETISWKWNHFWKRTIPGSIIGLSVGLMAPLIFPLIGQMILVLIVVLVGFAKFGRDAKQSDSLMGERNLPPFNEKSLPLLNEKTLPSLNEKSLLPLNERSIPLSAVLIVGLIGALSFGLVSGLVGGLTDIVKVGKPSPNQGIKLSRNNSLAAFLVTLLVTGLTSGLMVGLIGGLPIGLTVGLSFGLFAALTVGLNRGGSAVIKHYALRLTLWLNGYTPRNFVKFLDHCAKLIFLKKVGGGYIFIHRMLLDYFADLNPQSTKAEKGTTGSVGR